jgi:hypothetical protein
MLPEIERQLRSRGLLERDKTRRHHLNVYYGQRAMAYLVEVGETSFRWLFDRDAMRAGGRATWRKTILAELGRIEDEAAMLAMARLICEQKPKTRVAGAHPLIL